MPSRLLRAPLPGETLIVPAPKGKLNAVPPVLDFGPTGATLVRVGDDLIIFHPDGGRIVVQNYYTTDDPPAPYFLENDQEIPLAAPNPVRSTSDSQEMHSAGDAVFEDRALLQGLDKLDGLSISHEETPRQVTQGAISAADGRGHTPAAFVNSPPTVASARDSVTEDSLLRAVNHLPQPHDPDSGDTLSFTLANGAVGRYGQITLSADGVYTYTLNDALPEIQALGAGQSLTEVFTYTVSDGHGGTVSNTLTITVNGTNDVPTVAAATAAVTEDTQTSVAGTLPTPQDVDTTDHPEFIPKTEEAGTYGTLTLAADGQYTYTLNNASPVVQALGVGQSLTETFTYTVSDGHGGTASNTLTITVNGTNDVPTVATTTAAVTEDTLTSVAGTLPTPQDVDASDHLEFRGSRNLRHSHPVRRRAVHLYIEQCLACGAGAWRGAERHRSLHLHGERRPRRYRLQYPDHHRQRRQ